MTLTTVQANVIFYTNSTPPPWNYNPSRPVTAVSSGDQSDILAAIATLYASSTAALLLENGTTGGAQIRIGLDVGNFGQYVPAMTPAPPALPTPDYLRIDWGLQDIVWYVNDKGVWVQEELELTLIHELIHMIDGTGLDLVVGSGTDGALTDADMNTATFEHRGATVDKQNTIAAELGGRFADNIQASYLAIGFSGTPRHSYMNTGVSWTNNETIDIVRFARATGANTIDTSLRSDDSRDLLFGFEGDDIIKSGGGNDFLYGGAGADTVEGGMGVDTLYGEAGNDVLRIDGVGGDTVQGGADTDTLEILINDNYDQALLAVNGVTLAGGSAISDVETINFIDEAYGLVAVDTAIAITVTRSFVGSWSWASFAHLTSGLELAVDATGGFKVDQATFAQFGGFIATKYADTITLNYGHGAEAGDGDDTIVGVGAYASGGNGSDTIVLGGGGFAEGGDGADFITLSGGGVVEGGDGVDTITVSGGAAYVRGGAGVDIIDVSGASSAELLFGANDEQDVISRNSNERDPGFDAARFYGVADTNLLLTYVNTSEMSVSYVDLPEFWTHTWEVDYYMEVLGGSTKLFVGRGSYSINYLNEENWYGTIVQIHSDDGWIPPSEYSNLTYYT